jgi:uncharacterized membrane protein
MFSIVPTAYAAVDAQAFGKIIDPIISHIVVPIVQLMFAVAIIVFVYGVIQMVIKGEDAEARAKSKMSIMGGLIGMLIMLSAWGIIYLISNTVSGIK